ncbi:MAG: hypothetical protein N3A38_10615 [Planctomycetota bacterium]|nr:hypothetical protein [Planctomycetota bacterium]
MFERCPAIPTVIACVLLSASSVTSVAGEASAPPRPAPLTPDEIKAELAKETPEQKALRAELAELARRGEKIYFASTLDGTSRVYVMAPDGSGLECLTPPPATFADKPHVSPDGRKLVVNYGLSKEEAARLPVDPTFKRPPGNSVLAIVDIATRKVEPLCLGDNGYWSPDGKKICYNTDGRQRKIGIFDVEKKTERIVNHPGIPDSVMFPNFSPDGRWLLIGGYPFSLAELNPEGTGLAGNGRIARLNGIGGGCNNEFSKDGKLFVYVIDTYGDAGGWICWAEFNPGGNMVGKKLPLGWPDQSVNYYPDLSPDGKYMVYSHAEMKSGVQSWTIKTDQELYVTRFPDCKATVRLTWNRARNMHPVWWGPPGAR